MRVIRPRPITGFRVVREGSNAMIDAPYAGQGIRSPRDAVAVIKPLYGNEDIEVFGFLPLNTMHVLIGGPVIVSRGILNSSLIHPREVFRAAIALNAPSVASLILFHNHPSGDVTPSADDKAVTASLVAAGKLLDIPVVDHIIIGPNVGYTSFAEAGLF